MKNSNKLEFRYLSRHWTKPLHELIGYKMLEDIMTVFGYNEQLSKYVIRQWFSKCHKLEDDWFETKVKLNPNPLECYDDDGLGYDDGWYGEVEEDEGEEDQDDADTRRRQNILAGLMNRLR